MEVGSWHCARLLTHSIPAPLLYKGASGGDIHYWKLPYGSLTFTCDCFHNNHSRWMCSAPFVGERTKEQETLTCLRSSHTKLKRKGSLSSDITPTSKFVLCPWMHCLLQEDQNSFKSQGYKLEGKNWWRLSPFYSFFFSLWLRLEEKNNKKYITHQLIYLTNFNMRK